MLRGTHFHNSEMDLPCCSHLGQDFPEELHSLPSSGSDPLRTSPQTQFGPASDLTLPPDFDPIRSGPKSGQERASAEIRAGIFRPNSHVNFAGDFFCGFFGPFSLEKTGGKNPQQNSNQNLGASRPKSKILQGSGQVRIRSGEGWGGGQVQRSRSGWEGSVAQG